ncbi:hypothetical protein WDL1CHR_04309 [Variovorax sp. WDL1]|nr:hypothetical protein CHC07_01477 [Variovorax sp. B4]PNG60461.1 hypothetical protein CHC06_00358 [Variovorax sp. B2]VTV13662.1 hypothetical protein WDL1CHR_04309 [Variovorax sp. WDL1]
MPLLGIVLFGLTVGVSIPTANGPFVFSWDSSGSSAELSWGVFGVVTLIILLGVALIIRDIRREDREKVIVIEARGLRDWQGEALERAVPTSVRGRREQVMIDVRQGLVDGQIVSPETAIRRLSSLPEDIARRCDGLDRADLSFVVGGLAPVPLLFLLGVIVDDESQTLIMDWDRQRRIWRPLDEEDDGKRFAVAGLDALTPGTTRVALCVSASYDVLEADVRLVEPTAPIIRLVLDSRSTASHWSEQKQQQLAQQFLDIVMSIARQGVTDIALFLAAPASISLRLGTVYDKRNLPRLELNQFEQADPKKYPWAVRMPVAGVTQAQLIQR